MISIAVFFCYWLPQLNISTLVCYYIKCGIILLICKQPEARIYGIATRFIGAIQCVTGKLQYSKKNGHRHETTTIFLLLFNGSLSAAVNFEGFL
jgi:hypothetical protein